jgi:peptidyl-prolyl cis-trans isomerase C
MEHRSTKCVLITVAAAAVAAVAACASGSGEPVVARVVDKQITAAEFQARATRMLRAGYRSLDTLGMEAKRELLGDIIAQELIVYEGLQRGLDKDPQIADEVGRLEQRALIETLYTRQATPSSDSLTEEQIRDFYARHGYDTQVLSEQIVTSSADSARQVLAKLRGGGRFADLAPQYSLQHVRRRFGEDGNVGWFLLADMLPPLVEPMRTMEVGSLTPTPVRSTLGYHVFRLNGRRPVALDSVRSVIVKKLEAQRREQDRLRYVNQLRERYELKPHPEAIGRLHALPPDAKEWPGEDEAVLSWKGGRFTCRDYMALHRLGRVRHPSSLALPDLQRLCDNLAGQQVMKAEARQLGYDQLESIRAAVERKRNQLVVTELYRLEGRGKVPKATDAQVDSFLAARYEPGAPLDPEAVSPTVRERARSLLGRDEGGRAMDEFIGELRERNRDRIRIFDEVLAQVTLER